MSTDSNATNATHAIAPSSGFNQTTGPATAPPVPSAVAAQAAQFQQFASQFGRRLQSQSPPEVTEEEKPKPIRLPLEHSNVGSHDSAMAREADALRRSVVAANQVLPHSFPTYQCYFCASLCDDRRKVGYTRRG